MQRFHLLSVVCLVLVIGFSPYVYAAITGSISGRVLDPSGAALVGVSVTALNEDTHISQMVKTDNQGSMSLPRSALEVIA